MSRIRFPPDGKFGKGIDKKVCFLYLAWATKGYAYFDTMERKNRKIYYTMGEVSEMFDVNPSLIRFWEQKFDILKPDKNKKGNRLFTPKDVENLKLIYHLVKENGMTLAGAAKRLRDNREGVERNLEIIEKLQGMRALLLEVREELKSGGDEIFIDTSVPETATAAPSLQTDAAAVPDRPYRGFCSARSRSRRSRRPPRRVSACRKRPHARKNRPQRPNRNSPGVR